MFLNQLKKGLQFVWMQKKDKLYINPTIAALKHPLLVRSDINMSQRMERMLNIAPCSLNYATTWNKLGAFHKDNYKQLKLSHMKENITKDMHLDAQAVYIRPGQRGYSLVHLLASVIGEAGRFMWFIWLLLSNRHPHVRKWVGQGKLYLPRHNIIMFQYCRSILLGSDYCFV